MSWIITIANIYSTGNRPSDKVDPVLHINIRSAWERCYNTLFHNISDKRKERLITVASNFYFQQWNILSLQELKMPIIKENGWLRCKSNGVPTSVDPWKDVKSGWLKLNTNSDSPSKSKDQVIFFKWTLDEVSGPYL